MDSDGTPLNDLSARIQKAIGRVAIVADCAHSLGASRVVSHTSEGAIQPVRKYCGAIADFTSFSFHAVNVFKIEGDVDFCNKVLNNTCLAA